MSNSSKTYPILIHNSISSYPLTLRVDNYNIEDDAFKTIQATQFKNTWIKSKIFIDRSLQRDYLFLETEG